MSVTRREFLITLAGTAVGRVMLSTPWRLKQAAAEPTVRLVTVPTRTPGEDGKFTLLWMEETDDGVKAMIWVPETPQEIEEATAFYEAAVNHVGVAGVRQAPKTAGGKVARWLKDLLEPDPRRRTKQEWALLRDVVADRDAYEPLLKYADWLSARGSPQGEFIRASCALDRLPETDFEREHFDQRWTELYSEHGEQFVAPLQRIGLAPVVGGTFLPSFAMERGVISRVEVQKPGILPDRMEELFELAPLLRELWISYEDVRLAEIVGRPQIGGVQVLRVSGSSAHVTADDVRALAASPHIHQLRELILHLQVIGPEGARHLAGASFLPGLRTLSLAGCHILPEGAQAILQRDCFEQLRWLDLSGCQLDGETVTFLAGCRSLRGLEHLDLECNINAWDGLPALPRAAFAESVKTLVLESMNPVSYDLIGFARGDYAQLESLTLAQNRIQDDALAALTAAPWLAGLKELHLAGNDFTPDSAERLRRVSFRRLERLDLRGSPLEDSGAILLARSPGLSTLDYLDLRGCGIGPAGIRALARAPFSGLRTLLVSDNDIGPEGGRALAETQSLELTALWVDKQSVGPESEALLRQRYGRGMQFD